MPPTTGWSPLADWFRKGLAADPTATAVRSGARTLTYQALDRRATILAGALSAEVPRPARVGIYAPRGDIAYTGLLAALYAGAAMVPLNPDFPSARTKAMIEAAELSAILVDEGLQADVRAMAPEVPTVGLATPYGPSFTPVRVEPDTPAYILFTSGSTGRPKGVPVTHQNVDHYLRTVAARYEFTSRDVFTQTFDLTFDLAMFDLFSAWGCGGTVVRVGAGAMLDLPRFLAEHGVTVWFSAPSSIRVAMRARGFQPGSMPGLRLSLFCGEALLEHQAHAWQSAATASRLENLYGPTELTISCAAHRWDPETTPPLCVNGVVPIGEVHEGLQALLLDPESGRPGTTDQGELAVSGPQVFPGYLDSKDDADRFVEWNGRCWYRTGDLVRRLEKGGFAYLGRTDHQVNVHGVRIELAEVDWAMGRCGAVDQAVTVLDDGELCSFYIGTPTSRSALIDQLEKHLPRQVVPRRIHHLEAFPLNANQKIDRGALSMLASETRSTA